TRLVGNAAGPVRRGRTANRRRHPPELAGRRRAAQPGHAAPLAGAGGAAAAGALRSGPPAKCAVSLPVGGRVSWRREPAIPAPLSDQSRLSVLGAISGCTRRVISLCQTPRPAKDREKTLPAAGSVRIRTSEAILVIATESSHAGVSPFPSAVR